MLLGLTATEFSLGLATLIAVRLPTDGELEYQVVIDSGYSVESLKFDYYAQIVAHFMTAFIFEIYVLQRLHPSFSFLVAILTPTITILQLFLLIQKLILIPYARDSISTVNFEDRYESVQIY